MKDALNLRTHVQRLASRPSGVCSAEVTGFSATQVRAAIWHLMQAGALHRAKLAHKVVRYFTDAQLAAQYERLHRRAPATPVTSMGQRNNPTHKSLRAWWPADAPMVITEHTKITVAKPLPQPIRTNTHSGLGGA